VWSVAARSHASPKSPGSRPRQSRSEGWLQSSSAAAAAFILIVVVVDVDIAAVAIKIILVVVVVVTASIAILNSMFFHLCRSETFCGLSVFSRELERRSRKSKYKRTSHTKTREYTHPCAAKGSLETGMIAIYEQFRIRMRQSTVNHA